MLNIQYNEMNAPLAQLVEYWFCNPEIPTQNRQGAPEHFWKYG